ncbi:MAG: outer membrane protein assembly factor BamD [Bradyrhizobiaceae bacterium]|nr:outer membrane protein assembly factor BamD [Bradyrhizobiaceae bacterium]
MRRLHERLRGAGFGIFAWIAAAVVLSAPLGGCANIFGQDKEQALPDEPADKLYNEGLTLLNKKEYKDAAKKFEEVDRQHPYSEWARKSLLMTAFTYYEIGEHEETIQAARRYLALHPGSPDAAYAQYLMASSYYDQIPDITRDQQRTERAMQALDEVIRKYPDTEYAESARRKLEIARDQLAGKEMLIGRYYLDRRNYTGAINRFKSVVTQYQTTRHVEEALLRLAECYMALGIVNEAQTAAAVLGHNFPDSPWYKDAYRLVTTGGVSPQEDKASWISKAFGLKPSNS